MPGLNMHGIILPASICFHGVVLSEAHGLSLYSNTTVMSLSNCTVLGILEPHQWRTWPSAYNLLHSLIGTELLHLTVWLILHLIWGQLPTPSRSISHLLISVSAGLPTGRDIITCHVISSMKCSYLPYSYYSCGTVKVIIRITGTLYRVTQKNGNFWNA